MYFPARQSLSFCFFFFFNDTATTEIYTLSLHDALPICPRRGRAWSDPHDHVGAVALDLPVVRSEEHTSELQSLAYLVCRLLLEKKKITCNSLFKRCRVKIACIRTMHASCILVVPIYTPT